MLILRRAALALVLVCASAALVVASASPASAAGTLTVSVVGKGDVTGPGISCSESGPDCAQFYPDLIEQECDPEVHPPCHNVFIPQEVELTAGPDRNGFAFANFTGCDSTAQRTCQVTMDNSKSVTAVFTDVTGPIVSLTGPADGSIQSDNVTLAASASDNSGTVARVDFFLRGALQGTDTIAPYNISVDTAVLADGAATISAMAVDGSGLASSASRSIVIDNTAPTLGVSGPNGQTFGGGSTQTWTLSPTDANGVASTVCSVAPTGTTPAFGACTSPTSHSVTNLPEGSYTFTAKTTDNAGNETAATASFSIDTTGPDTSITSGPAQGSLTRARTVTFGLGSTEAGSTFQCRVYKTGTTAPAYGACSGASSHTITGLADGSHVFEVLATDAVGNSDASAVSRTFRVDGTAPQTQILTAPKSTIRTSKRKVNVRFTFGSNESGSLFRCSLDGGAWKACATPSVFKVKRGTHTLRVMSTDRAGNSDKSPASFRWKVKKKP